MDRIPVAGPWVTEKEIAYVADAAANAWYANHAVYATRFEAAFAEYIGTKKAIALPSCTSAIHLSLAALGIGPGDEVIVPDVTWIASAAPITYMGATPIFVDINENTWCIDPDAVAAAITSRTKAIISVDLYGNMPDIDRLVEVAARNNISLIEDAAEALGAEYKGRKAGSFGVAGVFSFHGSKTLTTGGEGGMLVTDNDDLYQRALFLRDHGRPPGDRLFYNTEVAFKYRMTSLQAAFGLAQLERMEELVCRKREIFSWYEKHLRGVKGITLNYEAQSTKNTYWMVTILFDKSYGLCKLHVINELDKRGIDSRPFFYPLSSLPAYDAYQQARMIREHRDRYVGYRISERGVNLPSGFNLDEPLVERVCQAVKEILSEALESRSALSTA